MKIVAIKGMEMPESCEDCDMAHNISGYQIECAITGESLYMFDGHLQYLNSRHPDCPLVEVENTPKLLDTLDAVLEELVESGRCLREDEGCDKDNPSPATCFMCWKTNFLGGKNEAN